MDWLSRHASEILVAVITASLIQLVDYLFAKRSKVFFLFHQCRSISGWQCSDSHDYLSTLEFWPSRCGSSSCSSFSFASPLSSMAADGDGYKGPTRRTLAIP